VLKQLADWDAGSALGDNTRAQIGSCSALAVVTTQGDRPEDFVRCGGAVARTWLAAEAAGLAVHPVSPLFIYAHGEPHLSELVGPGHGAHLGDLAGRFRTVFGLEGTEQLGLVLRLSHAGPPSVRSQRLPLDSVLTVTNHGHNGRGKLLSRAHSRRR
jgi:hypothetical protein